MFGRKREPGSLTETGMKRNTHAERFPPQVPLRRNALNTQPRSQITASLILLRLILIGLGTAWPATGQAAERDGDLRIEIITAYNLVVDSNVESPSTYAPRAAFMAAKLWNDGTNELKNVVAMIGNYNGGVSPTPGIYPMDRHPSYPDRVGPLTGPLGSGYFALTHEGGSAGLSDATRFFQRIPAGGYVAVYWLISYPNLDIYDHAVWGPSVKPDDDLVLRYDIWATAKDDGVALAADVGRTVTMRNEISAMANKILPNGANKVPDQYKELFDQYVPSWTNVPSDGTVGTYVDVQGIWYDLGNVGQGFDNDGDLIPDKNAWMQPVGDPSLFDSAAFRLTKTHAYVVVKLKSGGEKIYDVDDQLYFEHIPENNGAVGLVYYLFTPLVAGATAQLSPYQEVASGFDNEKFNGDYGASLGQLLAYESNVEIAKGVDKPRAVPGETLTYELAYTNAGLAEVGDPRFGTPLVIGDTIPAGTTYVAGSATNSLVLPTNVLTYTVLYSTNSGLSWVDVEPPADSITDIQWWLSDALESGAAGSIGFQVDIDPSYALDSPLIVNTGRLSFGNSPPFDEDDDDTLLLGTNRLGDTIFSDTGEGAGIFGDGIQNGTEPGLGDIAVSLYYDLNTNGVIDSGDFLVGSTNSASDGSYLFEALPDGMYLAKVDVFDADVPTGYTITSDEIYWADLDSDGLTVDTVEDLNADFGFAPALTLDKQLVGTSPVYERDPVTFTIDVRNELQGDGVGGGAALPPYELWAEAYDAGLSGTGNKAWTNPQNLYNPPGRDGTYARAPFVNAGELVAVTDFQPNASQPGQITKVEVVMPIVITVPFTKISTMSFHVHEFGNATEVFSTNFANVAVLTTGDLEVDITTAYANWTWDLLGTNLSVQIETQKAGGETGKLDVEAIGLRVTTDATGRDATRSTVLQPVPLHDTYDADQLEFVSAIPIQTSVTVTGTPPNQVGMIYWNDVGPIYPGGTTNIIVNFTALEPISAAGVTNVSVTTTNTAYVNTATFQNGRDANSATDRVDVVVLPTGSIGDFVWRDLSNYGVQDGGDETGIANVTVQLTFPDLSTTTTVTDANGYYLFDGLRQSGTYQVTVLTATLPGNTFTNTYDEDSGIASPDNTTQINGFDPAATSPDDNHLTADFGYIVPSVIEGTIWHDIDQSGTGTPDPGEDWLAGITVTLYAGTGTTGTVINTAFTDANGYFVFAGPYVGAYTVVVDTNSGPLAVGDWTQSFDTDGTNTANQATTTLPALGTGGRVDYSYYQTGLYRIGDRVFYDWNGDGDDEAGGDPGLSGVRVYLYEDDTTNGVIDAGIDAYIATATTDANGTYLFPDRPNGAYIVRVESADIPATYAVTADPYGALDGRSALEIADADNLDQDFGYMAFSTGLPAEIGDTVWRDVNADGAQFGPAETGIVNVTVTLYASINGGNYTNVATTTTDANGKYLFSGVPSADYRVVVDTADSDLPLDLYGHPYFATTPTSVETTIANGVSYYDADFGFAPLGAIGDTIFWDSNGDGTQDYNEPGITNITVSLYNDVNGNRIYDPGIDTPVTNDVTDADGKYLFTGLPQGMYIIATDTNGVLNGIEVTSDPDADGDPEGPGRDGLYGHTLGIGQNFMGADFGFQPIGVLGDTLWIDQDNDGERDASEFGIAYITVSLYTNDVLVATNVTDADGHYLFDNLPDATYEVVVSTNDVDFPPGLTLTYDPDGALNSVGSNLVMSNGHLVVIGSMTCTTNCDLDVDFGYRYSGLNSLSGTVGLDGVIEDGLMNGSITNGYASDEAPFSGVTVYVYLWDDDGNGNIDPGERTSLGSTVTDSNGDYAFTGLADGDGNDTYIVSLMAPSTELFLTTTSTSGTPGDPVVNTTNLLGYSTSAYQVIPIPGTLPANITNVDFAYRAPREFDYGDLPSSYSTSLHDAPAGPRHRVRTTPDLYLGQDVDTDINGQPTTGATGDDDDTAPDDEDGVVVTPRIWTEGSDGAEFVVEVGAGDGWLVAWVDFNRSGDFTGPGEMVINQAVSSSVGMYTVSVDVASGALTGSASVTNLYARFRLFPEAPFYPAAAYIGDASNGEVEDYQFTFAAVGDYVWLDANWDGVQDPGEPPIAGVPVYIDLNDNGAYDAGEPNDTTDSSGRYYIGGLTGGTYRVSVDTSAAALNGFVPNYDYDSPSLPVGASWDATALITVSDGELFADADFGFDAVPTLARLVSFRAYADAGRVMVEWRTDFELNTLGFYLEREVDGEFVRINTQLLRSNPFPLPGNPGNTYRLQDPGAEFGGTYTYRLIEVEMDGNRRYLGPYQVTVDGLALSLADWSRRYFTPEQLLNGESDPDADPDADGHSNYEEYLTGSVPVDPASILKVMSIRKTAAGVELTWQSEVGRSYVLEASTNAMATFNAIAEQIPATPPRNIFTDPAGHPNGANYRVRLELP